MIKKGNPTTSTQAYDLAKLLFNHKCSGCKGTLQYAWDEIGLCDECEKDRNKIDYDKRVDKEYA